MLQAGLVELIRPPNMVVPAAEAATRGARIQRATAPAVKRGIINRLIDRIKRL
jgi:hypothetical protein